MSSESACSRVLLPHPSCDRGAVTDFSLTARRATPRRLELAFTLRANLTALELPPPGPAVRTDGLWRHTCFEVFVRRAGGNEYREYNFSPSGAWAAYHFTAYREGMAPLMKGAAPQITQQISSETCEVVATLDLSWLAKSSAGVGLRLGLSAVIEDRARVLSYWALEHPADKPDFHHADSFVVTLDCA